ncbi:MAG: hypothetical protein ACI3XF_03645 [Eubacteriales bacterium]
MKKNSSFKNIWSVLVMEMKFSKSTFVLLALGIPITLLIQFGGIYLPKVVLADLIAGKSFGTIILSSAIIIGALMLLKALDSAISGEIEVQRLHLQKSMQYRLANLFGGSRLAYYASVWWRSSLLRGRCNTC